MKIIIVTFALSVLGILLFTGQNFQDDMRAGNPDPRMRRLSPLPGYAKLPDYAGTDNYVNPNKTTRYIQSPEGVLSVSPNFRPHPTNAPGTQSETIIYASLLNPNLVFASANTIWAAGVLKAGAYISTNGGFNWYGSDTVSTLSWCDPGTVIDKNDTYIISYIALNGQIGVSYSTNFGLSWAPTVLLPGSTTSSDKNLSGTNYASSSPYNGHSYTVYSEFGGVYLDRIVFSRTTNSGVSWSTVIPISPPPSSNHFHQGADVTAGPEGNIYSVWANSIYQVPIFPEDSLGFGKSSDGGITWSAANNAAVMKGIRTNQYGPWLIGVTSFPRLDVDRSGGPRNGWIYVVAPEKNFPGGDVSDIYLWRSTDQGVTFSAPIRVNQDSPNGKLQFHSAINVDANGGVNVVYHDCRNSNANDSADTYVSRSIDGGNTWTDIKVNDAKFRPSNGIGDYIGITSASGRIIPNWADNRIGRYQSWAAIIDLAPAIQHTPLANTELITGNRIVSAVIIPAPGSGINPNLTKLFYAKNSTLFSSVLLTNSGGQNWTAGLPLSGAGVYNYYLLATDSLNRARTAPDGAPASYYSFTAGADTVKPVIMTIPIAAAPKSEWPAVVSAAVTDNIGIDSVWVKWYKNNTGTGIKQFKLLNTGGSTYAAAFNSDSSQVAFNDSVFYRVFAGDNSSNHNTDSTALYKFKIVNTKTACVGTGTAQLDYPFSTLFSDARTDMLYTSSEINTAGGVPGYIMKLGFDFTSVSSQTMNGFKIKIQNTTSSTISAFTSAGWTLCYEGVYTAPGTGLRYINLTTPFYYDGTSNLLVEICYNNTGPSVHSLVKGTSASGRVAHQHANLATGDGCTDLTSPSSLLMLPNVCFFISLSPIGIGNISGEIPSQYSLSQNYPNPFNPVTRIKFAVPKQGFVTLKIYDMLGHEVRTLVNDVKIPGNYSVDFDGAQLASGVYFCRMQSAGFTNAIKLVLIK